MTCPVSFIAKRLNIDYDFQMTYPLSFRRHVLATKARDKLTFPETAARFSIGIASLVRWSRDIEPKPYRRRRGLKIDMEALAQDVRDHPDAYQHERAARFGVTRKAIWQALKKLGVTYKKSDAPPEGGRRRTAVLPGEDRGP